MWLDAMNQIPNHTKISKTPNDKIDWRSENWEKFEAYSALGVDNLNILRGRSGDQWENHKNYFYDSDETPMIKHHWNLWWADHERTIC